MKYANIFQKDSGFSLIEIVVAVAATSILSLAVGTLLFQSKQQTQNLSRQIDVDRAHIHTLAIARNIATIREDFESRYTEGSAGELCFKNKSSYCGSYDQSNPEMTAPQLDLGNKKYCTAGEGDCYTDSRVTLRNICTSTKCTHIQVNVQTWSPNNSSIRRRVSQFNVPAIALVGVSSVDFSCLDAGGTRYVVGIDNTTGKAVCTSRALPSDTAATSCSGNRPLANFGPYGVEGGCQTVPATNCPQFGIGSSQGGASTCRSIAAAGS